MLYTTLCAAFTMPFGRIRSSRDCVRVHHTNEHHRKQLSQYCTAVAWLIMTAAASQELHKKPSAVHKYLNALVSVVVTATADGHFPIDKKSPYS